jgi:hypothetical protein
MKSLPLLGPIQTDGVQAASYRETALMHIWIGYEQSARSTSTATPTADPLLALSNAFS